MYKKNLAMRAGVAIMAGALTFSSVPINVYADVSVVESEADSRYEFDNSVVTGRVVINGVSHYIDSSNFSFTMSDTDGVVGINESFLDRADDTITYNGKTYRYTTSVYVNGAESWLGYTNDAYGTSISYYNPANTYTIEFVYNLEEIVTSKSLPVSVDADAWKYYSYGTWKNLNIKVNDTVTALSKDSAADITFSNGDTVKVLAGDSHELWTGSVSVNDDNVYFTGKSSAKSWECTLDYADGAVTLKKTADTAWGGGEGGTASTSTFNYDFTAIADDGSPLSGISVTDNTAVPYYDMFTSKFESGKTYTWGTGNSYTFTRDDYDGTGVVTCSTDETGYTDMLVPMQSQSIIDAFGANQFMSGNLQLGFSSATPYSVSGNVFVGNGLIDFDTTTVEADGRKANTTLDSLGVSTSLEKFGTRDILGDYFKVVKPDNRADTVVLKDAFGNEIGTVTMSVDSTDYLTPVDDTYSIVGKNLKGSVVPKATITMADGVTDWRVSAEYEDTADGLYAGTFHITATKTNKADISVYDVYGAEVKDGVVDTSEATTIARFEEDYVEPNSSVSLSNKGEYTIDGVTYSPIVGDDLVVPSMMRSISSRLDVVQSDSVDVDIEPNGSYSVYFYYEAPKEAPKTYNLKVVDVYGTDEVVRDTKTVTSGYEYSYEKNEKDDWKVTGTASYSGTVTEDTTLYFYYERPAVSEPVTIKVFDHFGSVTEERVNKTVDKGTAYNYSSLTRDGWIATGTKNYSGTANEDVELHFYYELPAVEEKVNIKVIDVYGTNEVVRVDEDKDKGTSYSYDSINKDDYVVTGTSHYEGVLTEDTVLYFYYKVPSTPVPNPEEPTDPTPTPIVPDEPEPTPIIPSEPEPAPTQPSEPKTGETSIPYVGTSLASVLAFVTVWRKKRQ